MAETLLELKQKEFTNILFELPEGMTVNKFFQDSKKIGLAGEGVDFIFLSLDFKGQSLENVREVTQQEDHQNYYPASSNGEYFWVESTHGIYK